MKQSTMIVRIFEDNCSVQHSNSAPTRMPLIASPVPNNAGGTKTMVRWVKGIFSDDPNKKANKMKYCFETPLILAALIGVLASPTTGSAQTAKANPFAVAGLVNTACIFDTLHPELELPRSHAAFKAAGLPVINEGPQSGFYGDPAGTYFISNLTDDDTLACAAVIQASDLGYDGYRVMVQEIEKSFTQRYGAHVFGDEPDATSWIAKHGDGTKTVVTVSFHKKNGTSIASVATHDD